MNVDEKEVQKFDDISYSWWDPEGPFKPLHMLNPIRTNFIKKSVDLENKTLIDVGCGGGLLCENLASENTEIKGIDMSNESIEIAETHQTLKNLNINYQVSIIGAEYILNILPRGTHDYKNFIKPSEFASLLRKSSLEVKSIKGINYNLFSNKFYESDNLNINYIIHCKKIND